MKVRSTSNIAALVIEACGDDGCERLVSACGGRRISIPKKVGGKLLELLGADVLSVLVKAYADCCIDVPSRGHVERIRKSVLLKHEVIHSDLSANELASRHEVTAAYVYKLRSRLRGGAAGKPSTPKA